MQQGHAFRDTVLSEILPLRVVTKVAQMQWQVFCLPYNMFLYCLSWIAALLLRFLVVAGAPPSEYANKSKELQEEAEIRHRDKRKALVKLQKSRVALEALQAQAGRGGAEGIARASPRLVMHASLLLTTLAALWFFKHESVSSVSRKIVSSVIFPMWFVWAWSLSRRAPRSLGIGLYCCAWFVLGFVSCSWVSGAHLGE